MTIDIKLVDDLLKDYKKPEGLIGETGLCAADQGAAGARAVDRDERTSGLRQA